MGANSPLIVNRFIGISLGNNAVIAHRWKKVKKGLQFADGCAIISIVS